MRFTSEIPGLFVATIESRKSDAPTHALHDAWRQSFSPSGRPGICCEFAEEYLLLQHSAVPGGSHAVTPVLTGTRTTPKSEDRRVAIAGAHWTLVVSVREQFDGLRFMAKSYIECSRRRLCTRAKGAYFCCQFACVVVFSCCQMTRFERGIRRDVR